MATLVSPGVSVTYTDDTSYSAGTSTSVPLIVMGTQKNKTTPSGSIATGTLVENSNILQKISSQSELVSTYGLPIFYSNDGTPEHAYELNEYGLNAAYQFLALYNSCYILTCSIDYSQLLPQATSPTSAPTSGTYWLDSGNTSFGIFTSNGTIGKTKAWSNVVPTTITDTTDCVSTIMGRTGFSSGTTIVTTTEAVLSINGNTVTVPANSTLQDTVNAINSAAITNISAQNAYVAGKYYIVITQNSAATDLEINVTGTTQALAIGLGLFTPSGASYSSYIQPSTSLGKNGDFYVVMVTNTNIVFQKIKSVINNDNNASSSATLWYPVGSDIWSIATQTKNTLYMGNYNVLPTNSVAGDVWISNITKNNGMSFSIKVYSSASGTWTVKTVSYYSSSTSLPTSTTSGEIAVVYGSLTGIASYTPYISGSDGTWSELVYNVGTDTPTSDPSDGTYWYNNINYVVDIMINKNGQNWVGYKNYSDSFELTNQNGVIIAGSQPTTQTTGKSLVSGDIWLDSSDTENYPVLYRYDATSELWTQIDNTDDYSPDGIIFKDARQDDGNGSTSAYALTLSNNLDPDAPNPENYPDGMLLFNTRISTNNVKIWKENYFGYGGWTDVDYTKTSYTIGTTTFQKLSSKGRWVNASGNDTMGNPYMGRKAQRIMVVSSLKSAIAECDNLTSEDNYFQLAAAPGYIELIDDLVSLSIDKQSTVFVVGDTPARLSASTTVLNNFANPTDTTLGNSEKSITTSSSLAAVYYPWGLSSNTDGSTIMIPPSTIALRTIAYSDSVAAPWKAPAGYTRGIVTNASSVGYLDTTTNTFKSVILNQGQRDTLYQNNINPIAYIKGQGLVLYGQKTRQGTTTALDRINTQRTLCQMIYQLEQMGKQYLFENNTEHTRNLVQTTFTKYFSNLITLGAITDALVVCDTTNNTATTIDAHELFIDCVYIPVESIEFVYIPLRLVNTGTDLSTVFSTNTTTIS